VCFAKCRYYTTVLSFLIYAGKGVKDKRRSRERSGGASNGGSKLSPSLPTSPLQAEFGCSAPGDGGTIALMHNFELALKPEDINKSLAVVRSYPEGITVPSMMDKFEFSNSNALRAALDVLIRKGQARKEDAGRFFAVYQTR
jgi:hypothetical protein